MHAYYVYSGHAATKVTPVMCVTLIIIGAG